MVVPMFTGFVGMIVMCVQSRKQTVAMFGMVLKNLPKREIFPFCVLDLSSEGGFFLSKVQL